VAGSVQLVQYNQSMLYLLWKSYTRYI